MPDLRDLRGRPIRRTNGGVGPAGTDPQRPGRQPGDGSGLRPDPDARGGPDSRPRTRAEERIAELDVSPTKLVAEIESLRAELAAANAKADEYLSGLQRERAEFNNFRRRTTEEREQMLGLAGED